MTDKSVAPARITAILAREAPVGVLFRRGPSHRVQLIKWHTDTDTFEPGQWIRGELYERRSDLSPDGSLLAYYLEKRGHPSEKGYTQAWTAISKPPYFTALALWSNPYMDAGGGLFLDSKTFALSDLWFLEKNKHDSPHPDHQPPDWLQVVKLESNIGRSWDMNVHYEQLLRDGWNWVQRGSHLRNIPVADVERRFKRSASYESHWLDIWERREGNLSLTLRLLEPSAIVPGRAYPLDYELTNLELNITHVVKAHWMDWDQQGRLVYTLGGQLFEAQFSEGRFTNRELADFTSNTFESIEAPDWAKTW